MKTQKKNDIAYNNKESVHNKILSSVVDGLVKMTRAFERILNLNLLWIKFFRIFSIFVYFLSYHIRNIAEIIT